MSCIKEISAQNKKLKDPIQKILVMIKEFDNLGNHFNFNED